MTSKNITSEEAYVSWIISAEVGNAHTYFALYKRADKQSVEWKFIKTKQTRTRLRQLEPSTGYVVQILARTSSGKTYGSGIYSFETAKGEVTSLDLGRPVFYRMCVK